MNRSFLYAKLLTAPKTEELTPLPHSNWPLLETPHCPCEVDKVNPDPEVVAVNVAGVWTDHVPEVRTPPFDDPLDVIILSVDFAGTEDGA